MKKGAYEHGILGRKPRKNWVLNTRKIKEVLVTSLTMDFVYLCYDLVKIEIKNWIIFLSIFSFGKVKLVGVLLSNVFGMSVEMLPVNNSGAFIQGFYESSDFNTRIFVEYFLSYYMKQLYACLVKTTIILLKFLYSSPLGRTSTFHRTALFNLVHFEVWF